MPFDVLDVDPRRSPQGNSSAFKEPVIVRHCDISYGILTQHL